MSELDTAASGDPADERARRAERILDAATELLVAWGYRRVTIEDVAQRADVGKGTVYLHFATKEALFLTVLMRAQLSLGTDAIKAMSEDPATVLLSQAARHSYLRVQQDSMLRALFLRDTGTLGRLAQRAPQLAGDALRFREHTMDTWFAILQSHGLLRTDHSVAELRHTFNAILTGFLTVDQLMPLGTPETQAKAAMLADAVHRSLETSSDPTRLRAAAPEVVAAFDRLRARIAEEIRRHHRP